MPRTAQITPDGQPLCMVCTPREGKTDASQASLCLQLLSQVFREK